VRADGRPTGSLPALPSDSGMRNVSSVTFHEACNGMVHSTVLVIERLVTPERDMRAEKSRTGRFLREKYGAEPIR